MPTFLTPVRPTFLAVADTVVPEMAGSSAEAHRELEDFVADALAGRPESVKRQLVTFLRAIEFLPVVRYRTRFTKLAPDQRVAVLKALQDSRLLLLRRGFWGLRSLILMGHYSRPDVAQRVGYRASAAGWASRRSPNEEGAHP